MLEHTSLSTPSTTEDTLLFGHDPTPGLVALSPLGHASATTPAMMRLYQRHAASSRVCTLDVPWYPFFFLTDIGLLHGFPRARFRYQHLQGDNTYRVLVVFHSWQDYRDAMHYVEAQPASQRQAYKPLYTLPSPAQQYLLQTGRTLFKGMTLDDVHRLQLDIEVLAHHGFPHPQRPEDRVILIALADNRGWQHMLDGRTFTEPAMLRELVRIMQERDPDVIEGHNIYAFDLAYLMARCERWGVSFAIGRDDSVPRAFATSMRFAERTVDFPALDVVGRHIIDTYFQVLTFDVFKRDLPDYSLKTAAQYFGLAAPQRTYIAGKDIAHVWREQPDRLCAYARDDVLETARLAQHLSGSTFYLTQMLPMPYGQVARTGPAAKIEALLVRGYLRHRHSLPHPGTGTSMAGGYTDVFVTGVVGPVVYADVESLYPTIMLNYGIQPCTDALHLFLQLLRRLTALRLATKHHMQEATAPTVRSALDAQQSSYKILINSFYGQLGFRHALFNDFPAADRVAKTGQHILRHIISAIRDRGGTVIEVDTDGVFFLPPVDVVGAAAEQALVHDVMDTVPAGIRLGYAGRFAKMLSYKMKNYALLSYDGTLQYKGSALVSRAVEPFARQFMLAAIALLLREDMQGLHDLYIATQARLQQHAWGVEDFARTETLKDTIEQYHADLAARRRSRAAAYELASARAQQRGHAVRKGDRISYYVTGYTARVTTFANARLADEWDPSAPDENTAYYLKRLDECAQRFATFFTADDFQRLFTAEGLFGFSAAGLLMQTHTRSPSPNAAPP